MGGGFGKGSTGFHDNSAGFHDNPVTLGSHNNNAQSPTFFQRHFGIIVLGTFASIAVAVPIAMHIDQKNTNEMVSKDFCDGVTKLWAEFKEKAEQLPSPGIHVTMDYPAEYRGLKVCDGQSFTIAGGPQ